MQVHDEPLPLQQPRGILARPSWRCTGYRPSVDVDAAGVLRQGLCALGQMRRLLHALRLRFAVTASGTGSFAMAQPTQPTEACTNLASGMRSCIHEELQGRAIVDVQFCDAGNGLTYMVVLGGETNWDCWTGGCLDALLPFARGHEAERLNWKALTRPPSAFHGLPHVTKSWCSLSGGACAVTCTQVFAIIPELAAYQL